MNARSSQPSKSRFGLKDQSKDMSTVEIVAVFTTLLHFTKNMNIIPKVLEEKSVECLQQFKTRKCSLNQLKHDKVSQGISRRVSEWMVVNVHMVAKQATLAVTFSFLLTDASHRHSLGCWFRKCLLEEGAGHRGGEDGHRQPAEGDLLVREGQCL